MQFLHTVFSANEADHFTLCSTQINSARALIFAKSKTRLQLSKNFWTNQIDWFNTFWVRQTKLFTPEFDLLNPVPNLLVSPKQLGRVQYTFGLIEGQGIYLNTQLMNVPSKMECNC